MERERTERADDGAGPHDSADDRDERFGAGSQSTAVGDEPIGMIAGWGAYPVVIARGLREQGRRLHVAGVVGHADSAALRPLCDRYVEIGLPRLGAAIRFFRRAGVRRAVMAGKIHKVRLFERGAWRHLIPDWTTFRTFFPHFAARTRDRKDDTLLGAVVGAFGKEGIVFEPATDFLPQLLVEPGVLGRRSPTAAQRQDIEFGWQLAKELGRLDCGQSVAVKGRAVLALEAIEGTDACIRRAGELCTSGGFTVVKVAKPQQDMRFDVPTIGLGTLRTLVDAGASVLAVEAGKTILLDRDEVIRFANEHQLAVVAVDARQMAQKTAAA